MKITFDRNVYALIKDKVLKDITSFQNNPVELQKYEFEVRFGEFTRTFKPFITDELAIKLKKFFSDKKIPYNYSETKVEIFKDKIRKITTLGDKKSVRFEKKESLLNNKFSDGKDITTHGYKDFAIRFGYAKEEKIEVVDESVLGDVIETRDRKRYEYEFPNYIYSITHVSDHIEFEIEYKLSRSLLGYGVLQTHVENSIEFVLPYMVADQEIITYMPLAKQEYLRRTYLESIKMSKPVNVERQSILKIKKEKYTVTNKLDGERFFIVFNPYGIFAINYNVVDELQSMKDSRYQKNSILDCERYKGKFYVFDCLVYNGDQLMETHSRRLQYADRLIRSYSFMQMKKFEPIVNTEKLITSLSKEENDGLIFTPEEDASKIIFKWKFPEKMSIDFRVKYDSAVDAGGYLYRLFSYDSTNQFVPFTGTVNFPLVDANYISDELLLDEKIYEFMYNNDENKFVLLRLRPDKQKPNFITVAQNVWNDIKNPFTQDELIKLLYHTSDDDLAALKVINPMDEYRKHHNMAKRDLISKYCGNRDILDLGFGRGGDLSKYNDVDVKHIWGIEPDQSNLNECKKRLHTTFRSMVSKTYVISGKAQDTDRIQTFIAFPPVYVNPYDRTDKTYKADNPATWFPFSANIDYKNIMFTEEGKYSVTKRPISNAFIAIMKGIFDDLSLLTITDATSNIGGDTIQFGLHFKSVVGIEINPENFEALRNNVGVYGLKNVELMQGNSMTLWNSDNFKCTNLLFIDPPWGGPEYDKETAIDIFLYDGDQKIPLDVILSSLKMPSHGIFLKLPYNYQVEKLLKIKGINDIRFYSVGQKILLAYLDTRSTTPYTIEKSLRTRKIDVITSFFSLSFFFFNSTELDKLVRTISTTLKPGGLFIGTTIDGERTKRLLDLSNGEFVFNGGHIRWGENNTVNIFMKDSIMGDQIESLVDFNRLCDELHKYGIILKETRFIEDNKLLTPTTQKLNSLYRKFVFERLSEKDMHIGYAERLIQLVARAHKPECFTMFLRLCKMPDEVDVDHKFSFALRFPGNVVNQFEGMMMSAEQYKKIQLISSILPNEFKFRQYDGISVSSTTYFVIKLPQESFKVIDVMNVMKKDVKEVQSLLLQCLAIVYLFERHHVYVDYKQFECVLNNNVKIVNINEIPINIGKFIVKIPETITFLKKPMNDVSGRVVESLKSLRDEMSLSFPIADVKIDRSAIGMPNLGNTCYFNSSMQAIASISRLVNYFKDDGIKDIKINKDVITRGKLVPAFSKLLSQLTTNLGKKVVGRDFVTDVRKAIGLLNPEFGSKNFSQQDADEFISMLLELLHVELNTKDGIDKRYMYDYKLDLDDNIQQALDSYFSHNDSIISRLFTIMQKITLQCQICGNKRAYIEPTYTCNIILPTHSSDEIDLQTLLNNYTTTEKLDDVFCEMCDKQCKSKSKTCVKTPHLKITENVYFSPVVKITFVRFKGQGMHRLKNDIMVDFQFTIKLNGKTYSLDSVSNHLGSATGGHYFTYGRIGDEWYDFNDSGVSMVDDVDDVRARSGYVLFYSENNI